MDKNKNKVEKNIQELLTERINGTIIQIIANLKFEQNKLKLALNKFIEENALNSLNKFEKILKNINFKK